MKPVYVHSVLFEHLVTEQPPNFSVTWQVFLPTVSKRRKRKIVDVVIWWFIKFLLKCTVIYYFTTQPSFFYCFDAISFYDKLASVIWMAIYKAFVILAVLTFWLRDAPTSLTFNNCTFCPHCIYVFCKQRLGPLTA
jgi:hypothetical protein